MVFQLAVFSLYLLLLLLVAQVIFPLRHSASGRPASRGSGAEGGDQFGPILRDAVRTYLLTASFALLAYLQGKPDLLPQYLVWIVFALTLVKAACLWQRRETWARWIGAITLVILIWLWIQELPIFQSHPA